MKKILSMILALAMILSLGITAFAEEANWTGNGTATNGTQSVTASYTNGTDSEGAKVYHVIIAWTDASLTYTAGNVTYNWNADQMKYVPQTGEGSLTDSSVQVTITNKSNAAITATLSYSDNDEDQIATESNLTEQNNSVVVSSAAVNGGSEIPYNNTELTGSEQTESISATISITSGTPTAEFTAGSLSISLTHD